MPRVLTDSTWSRCGTTLAKGTAFVGDRLLTADRLAQLLDACADDERWTEAAGKLNGCFAALRIVEGHAIGAVDRVRTIPLFYALRDGVWHIGEHATDVHESTAALRLDDTAALEFLLTGYVTGHETLLGGLRQVGAGEIARLRDGDPAPRLERYYTFTHGDFFDVDDPALIDRLHVVHGHVFERLLRSAGGRPLIVPLSGGYDSRLIVAMLKELGARDVVCFTYGTPGSWETSISSELARHLGYPLIVVPYTAQRWAAWAASDGFEAYLDLAGNLSSVPHAQDWPAITEMLREQRIPRDGIVVPGHTGDFLFGGHVPPALVKERTYTVEDVSKEVVSKHYVLWPWSRYATGRRRDIEQRVAERIGSLRGSDPEAAADAYERWDHEQRQARFICNSVRVYDAHGLGWRLPLWDHELMQFWSRVPVRKRFRRNLYFEYVATRQRLPVRVPNTDRSAPAAALVALASRAAAVRAAAKHARRQWRAAHWRREWENCSHAPLAWLGAVDRRFFARTYSGDETLHSYVALRYLSRVATQNGDRGLLDRIGYSRLAAA